MEKQKIVKHENDTQHARSRQEKATSTAPPFKPQDHSGEK